MQKEKKLNNLAMELLCEMKPCNDISKLAKFSENADEAVAQCVALNRAIDALHMQNKALELIETIKDKPCFMTDGEGVITLLSGLLVGHEENM